MSVLGPGIKLIFCEGEPDSLDKQLLNRLLHGKPPGAMIVPAGGKHQMRGFIQGRLATSDVSEDYLAFRDRDFDVEPPDRASLIPYQSGRPIYMSHRAAVENYLIDASLIHAYWAENSRTAPRWSHGGSPGESDIQSWMDQAARDLADYQAVRWALASLKPSARWPELRTTWTRGSGYLPSSLDREACLDEAQKMVREFRQTVADVSPDRLSDQHKRFAKQFNASDFVTQRDYLIWFQGKDILKAMQKLRPNSISLQHFCGEWAVKHLDWQQHADLQELAAKI